MSSLIDRMIGAAKLQPAIYDEIERDPTALGQAMTVVALSSAAAGIGASMGGPFALIGGAVVSLVGWFIWAILVHFVGSTLLPEPGKRVELSQVLRVIGFSAAPGVIRVVAFIPVLGNLIGIVVAFWMLAAMVVAVRQVFGYANTGKAIVVCVIGWVIQMVILFLFTLIGVGSIMMAGF